MKPIESRPYGIWVSDLSEQLWCEKRLELTLEHGQMKSEEMKTGSERHQELHEELVITIPVHPISIEDKIALKLHNSKFALTQLHENNIAREVPVWGIIDSLNIVGKIDEIKIENEICRIIDTKTRKSKNLPSYAQKITTRFQLMLYFKLLHQLKTCEYDEFALLGLYSLDESSEITDDFSQEMIDIGDPIVSNIYKLSKETFTLFRSLPLISKDFQIRYEHQLTNEFIGSDDFQFDEKWFQKNVNFVKNFWIGTRNAIPVGERNRWKCNYCPFKELCENTS